jgi:hypothetical protein
VNNDRTGAGRAGGTRVTQREAAELLGVTVEAIRKRVARGTLRSDKGEDGRRYVYLDTDPDAGGPQPDSPALTSELRDRLRYVEGQLEAERQAHAEARRIIAGLVERMPPQLEAPQDERESPVATSDEPEMAVSSSDGTTTVYVDEATAREMTRQRLVRILVSSLLIVVPSYLITAISASGETFSSTISSVLSAFSSVVTSGLSAVTGDQIVTIISASIGVIGTLFATYLTIRATRRARNR